ncbi:hypothetical protein OIA45_19855 [Streptomyces chartreusis]|uniref:hypothetical protein n=1 Tax=Streptomyces chartreusis TaxID=1969 RepID=UPI003867B2FC|nr:hypothetical protein OIA45_19855 [Streptomyces chartreusis]
MDPTMLSNPASGDAAKATLVILAQDCQVQTSTVSTALTIAQVCTTAIIGIVASILAWVQSKNSRFRPRARAVVERDPANPQNLKRIAIRVSNKGGAAGTIRFIDVKYGVDFKNFRGANIVGWTPEFPIPFYLPGRAAAQVILEPGAGEYFSSADRIVYGYGLKTEKRVKIIEGPARITGKSILPPGSLPEPEPELRPNGAPAGGIMSRIRRFLCKGH